MSLSRLANTQAFGRGIRHNVVGYFLILTICGFIIWFTITVGRLSTVRPRRRVFTSRKPYFGPLLKIRSMIICEARSEFFSCKLLWLYSLDESYRSSLL